MEIKAVRMFDGGFMNQSFAFGGEEGKEAARDTLDKVREFIKNNPTVYLSTHCPEGYENLELKRVMKL